MTQVKAVELVLPKGTEPPAAPVRGTSWWIPALVACVLIINAGLVWYRLKGRDPLKRAFARVAGRIGLNRAERDTVERLAGPGVAPVALLISETAMDRAAADEADDPVIVSVRHKVRNARA